MVVRIVGERVQRLIEFALPGRWPAPTANQLVLRSGRVWRNLRTLVSHERLASDPRHVLRSVFQVVAPDRLSYVSKTGSAGIVIGNRRWDRSSAREAWQRSSQNPALRLPLPFWVAVRDAHIISSVRLGGRPAWRVTFFDPQTPAWFAVLLEKRTLRTLDLRMVTTAHFMHEAYGPFNQPLRLEPPR